MSLIQEGRREAAETRPGPHTLPIHNSVSIEVLLKDFIRAAELHLPCLMFSTSNVGQSDEMSSIERFNLKLSRFSCQTVNPL